MIFNSPPTTEETIEVGEASQRKCSWCESHDNWFLGSIDIVLDYVDKGVAIVELAKKLGLTMDQVMAFGDNLNDLHMMQVVGHPVAPENAQRFWNLPKRLSVTIKTNQLSLI